MISFSHAALGTNASRATYLKNHPPECLVGQAFQPAVAHHCQAGKPGLHGFWQLGRGGKKNARDWRLRDDPIILKTGVLLLPDAPV